jgi:hypothetical protein
MGLVISESDPTHYCDGFQPKLAHFFGLCALPPKRKGALLLRAHPDVADRPHAFQFDFAIQECGVSGCPLTCTAIPEIAYDANGDRLFVTGKNWPKLFGTRLVKKAE